MQSTPALRAVDEDFPLEVQPAEEPRPAPVWSPVKRLLFRFAFVYLVLYSFPFPLYYPNQGWVEDEFFAEGNHCNGFVVRQPGM